jgi:hypothetical protein
MKVRTANKRLAGLTLPEALLVTVSLALLMVVLFPAMGKDKAVRTKCSSNLKQVALGFVLWANERDARLPMEIPVSEGGSREHALSGDLVSNLMVVANQIEDHRALVCPSDKERKPAQTFAKIATANVSYFLNVNAAYANQAHVLAGDRDITTNGKPVRPGLLTLPDPSTVGWANVLHKDGGHVALVDASVHHVTVNQFRRVLNTGSTNRLIIP